MSPTFRSILARPSNRTQPNHTQHQATCSQCGRSTTLPFQPSQGKPVYCQACFQARRQNNTPDRGNVNGAVRSNHTMQSRNNVNGAVRPDHTMTSRSNVNGAVRPKHSTQSRNNVNGAVRPDHTMTSRSNVNGAVRDRQPAPRSNVNGAVRPNQTMPPRSNVNGAVRPNQTMPPRNNVNGAVRPNQTMPPRNNVNGAVRPNQTMPPRNNVSGAVRPNQAIPPRNNVNGAVRPNQTMPARGSVNGAAFARTPQRPILRPDHTEPAKAVDVALESWTVGSTFSDMPLKQATKATIAKMGISEPTPIQEKALPHLMAGRDLIGQARTGSGKTLAFAVPIAERCDPAVRRVQALVLVPTRELAIQVAGVVEALASAHNLRLTLLYGGRSLGPEYGALRRGAQIVIGTPGRTLDHLRQETLDLSAVRFFVLDEADEMLDRGFARDVEAIMAATPKDRQTALLSATMPAWVAQTAAKHLRQPARVEVDAGMQAPPSVEHLVYSIQKSEKMNALRMLLDRREDAPVIVFGKTKHGVKKLAQQLDDLGYPVSALQGNLSQNARERVMIDFRSGAASILVATNVAARGLDFESIGQVINYDLPDSELLFTHRVGRTGRMGRVGEAITFITSEEETKWREIERGLGRRFTRARWPAAPAR